MCPLRREPIRLGAKSWAIKLFAILPNLAAINKMERTTVISAGSGIIESIANSVSIRQNPEFVLKILGEITHRAIILKTQRNEAGKFLDRFLPYLEKKVF